MKSPLEPDGKRLPEVAAVPEYRVAVQAVLESPDQEIAPENPLYADWRTAVDHYEGFFQACGALDAAVHETIPTTQGDTVQLDLVRDGVNRRLEIARGDQVTAIAWTVANERPLIFVNGKLPALSIFKIADALLKEGSWRPSIVPRERESTRDRSKSMVGVFTVEMKAQNLDPKWRAMEIEEPAIIELRMLLGRITAAWPASTQVPYSINEPSVPDVASIVLRSGIESTWLSVRYRNGNSHRYRFPSDINAIIQTEVTSTNWPQLLRFVQSLIPDRS